jgi:hypothetical protein
MDYALTGTGACRNTSQSRQASFNTPLLPRKTCQQGVWVCAAAGQSFILDLEQPLTSQHGFPRGMAGGIRASFCQRWSSRRRKYRITPVTATGTPIRSNIPRMNTTDEFICPSHCPSAIRVSSAGHFPQGKEHNRRDPQPEESEKNNDQCGFHGTSFFTSSVYASHWGK